MAFHLELTKGKNYMTDTLDSRDDTREVQATSDQDGGDACRYDVLCFSHLRWDFVFQRPQHLITRFSQSHRVFYIEEPVIADVAIASLRIVRKHALLFVVTPVLPRILHGLQHEHALRALLDQWLDGDGIRNYGLFYYTPMALPFTRHLKPLFVAYDCMDELSSFKGAPTAMRANERALLDAADVVFTGGWSLFEAKRSQHANIHALPSSIDAAHFRRARTLVRQTRTCDAERLHLGFFGVIDERFDAPLVAGVASLRPNWEITIVGPVVKIDAASLPASDRIRYPGMATYEQLPQWLAQWDVAIMPFARNESTRFISPTKTPEYLAGGKPVVSTSIHDVVHPYAELGLVQIGDTPEAFVAACERAATTADADWLERVDNFLVRSSWDETWQRMKSLIDQAARIRARRGATRHEPAQLPLAESA